MIGNLPLVQMWAYKYDQSAAQGIPVHADAAQVNVNLWVTVDDANLDHPQTWTDLTREGAGEAVYHDGGEPSDDFFMKTDGLFVDT